MLVNLFKDEFIYIKMISYNKKVFSTAYSRPLVENLGHNVIIVDRDDENNLDLYCYTTCDNNNSDNIKQCRGVVYNEENIVMNAFPYTIEYNDEEKEIINEKLGNIFNECVFFDSYEGSLIRMFNFNGKWFISTHRKLDAFNSRWSSSESFGLIFTKTLITEYNKNSNFREFIGEVKPEESILEIFKSLLNPSYQYMFLVLNTSENRIVCLAPDNPTLYHVGTFIEGCLKFDENVGIPYTDRKVFTSIDDVIDFVRMDVNIQYLQGVICFAPNNIQYKIINKTYQDLFKIRGNEPSLKFRYLQIRMNKEHNKSLYDLYPEKVNRFDECENSIYDLSVKIYSLYVKKYIKKENLQQISKDEFNIISECHAWYKNNNYKSSVFLNKVIEIINTKQPHILNHLIKNNRNL